MKLWRTSQSAKCYKKNIKEYLRNLWSNSAEYAQLQSNFYHLKLIKLSEQVLGNMWAQHGIVLKQWEQNLWIFVVAIAIKSVKIFLDLSWAAIKKWQNIPQGAAVSLWYPCEEKQQLIVPSEAYC